MQWKVIVLGLFLATASSVSPAQETEEEALEPLVSSDVLAGMAIDEVAAEANDSSNDSTDEIELSVTEITGNQELPKMLYIVPWQKSDAGDLFGKPSSTALDDALAPIDRTEFVRQVDYYGDLYAEEEE